MPSITFRYNENDNVRVPKLNGLEGRVSVLEASGVGGTTLTLDGGDAATGGSTSIVVDAGGA